MIKFDKDALTTLKALEKAGFETFAIGACVMDAVRGIQPYDWDLASKATLKDMQELFPQGEIVDEEKQVLRIDFTYEVPGKDEDEPAHIEGVIVDVRHMNGSIEEEIDQYSFSCEAMADNPERTFLDPYEGREDIQKKLVRTTIDADAAFKEKPIKMMEAVRIASEFGFDLHKSVFDGILANWRLLMHFPKKLIRVELERILTSDNAGKGLNMMAGSGLMAVIVGEEISKKMSSNEMQAFTTVCENIDKTKPVRTRRLGLLYTVFNKKKGMAAIERLEFDEKTAQHLRDGLTDIIKIAFLHDEQAFKRYLFEHGMERYEYLHNLSKAMRIVYDQPTLKLESRNYLMRKIISGKEAIFTEDLVIDGNDLMEAGIAGSPETAEELLSLIIAKVHENPQNNDRDYLLKVAKKYSKNKLAVKARYIRWVK